MRGVVEADKASAPIMEHRTQRRDRNSHLHDKVRDASGNIYDELISEDSNDKYTVSMANAGEKNTGGSQMFLNVEDNEALDWFGDGGASHPVFGYVVEGKALVVALSEVETIDNFVSDEADRRPRTPVKVVSVTVANLPDPEKKVDPWA